MKAMVFSAAHQPLSYEERADPRHPGPHQVLIRVHACGVCRTDLHIVDGELTKPKLPLIPGHEIIGTVAATGGEVGRLHIGDRVGVPWLGWSCGECVHCRSGRENLCPLARFTGYDIDGGYAEYTSPTSAIVFRSRRNSATSTRRRCMCAGLIGYRALRLAGEGERVGLYGFGAAAHILAQVAGFRGQRVYAFTKPGDTAGQEFARGLGAVWAGGSDEMPPEPLDAALIFAPVGALVPAALAATAKGGTVVCAGIHMSDIPQFPYSLLWEERIVRSVANLTRQDGEEFLAIASAAPLRTATTPFPLTEANEALSRLRDGRIEGAAVLVS